MRGSYCPGDDRHGPQHHIVVSGRHRSVRPDLGKQCCRVCWKSKEEANRALLHVSENLLDTERLFAFQDDVYVCCAVNDQRKSTRLWNATQLWNRGSVAPQGWETLTAVALELDPSAVSVSLPPSAQGVKILGIPLRFQRSVLLTGSCWSGSLLSRICKLLGSCFSVAQHSPVQTEE